MVSAPSWSFPPSCPGKDSYCSRPQESWQGMPREWNGAGSSPSSFHAKLSHHTDTVHRWRKLKSCMSVQFTWFKWVLFLCNKQPAAQFGISGLNHTCKLGYFVWPQLKQKHSNKNKYTQRLVLTQIAIFTSILIVPDKYSDIHSPFILTCSLTRFDL